MSFRSPLARARGLGSAKGGTAHWLAQRLSAVALIPLALWFVASVLWLLHADYVTAVTWVHTPWVAVLLAVLLVTVFYHAFLGLQVVIEDYVHSGWLKFAGIALVQFLCVLLAAVGIFAVLSLAFGG